MQNLVLVVDDSKLARKISVKALKNGGFDNILEATTADETKKIFQEQQPSLVLLDITLPDNYDLTLLKDLLALNPEAKIIMVSAIGQDLIVEDSIKLGAKAFIIKPYDEEQLLETVFQVLEQKRDT